MTEAGVTTSAKLIQGGLSAYYLKAKYPFSRNATQFVFQSEDDGDNNDLRNYFLTGSSRSDKIRYTTKVKDAIKAHRDFFKR